MIPSFNTPSPPRPLNKVDFQQQLKELTSNSRPLKLDEKGALSNIKFIDIVELAFGPGIDETEVARELTSWLIYAKNHDLVEAADIEAIQDLAYKAKITPSNRTTEIERNLDDVINQIRHLDPETALTDLSNAIKNNDESTITSIIENNLPALQAAMLAKGKNNSNLLHTAVSTNNKRLMQLLIEHLPQESKVAMHEKDADGSTPLLLASKKGLSELVELMALHMPDEFKLAVLMGDRDANTPIHNGQLSALKIIEKYAPEEFMIGLDIPNKSKANPIATQIDSVEVTKFFFKKHPELYLKSDIETSPRISRIKATRPENYRATMDIFKTNPQIVNIAKEVSKRKAASHAFHIDGVSVVREKDSKNEVKLDLEGHFMPQWFRLMEKTLNQFQKDYPNALAKNEIEALTDTFKQNSTTPSIDETMDRIKKELPTVVQAGFDNEESGGHAVTFLFFGGHFIICNRGAGAETALDIYQYDQKKINAKTFLKISMVKSSGDLEDYERLISEVLPEELDLSKTEYAQNLEEWSQFPNQTIGNCSFISPITSVYALLLFSALERTPPNNETEIEPIVTTTVEKYQKWLGFLQLTILERLITPLTDPNRTIIPDHRFIREVLKNAYKIDLDKTNAKKLDEIATVYQNTLGPREANLLKTECIAWKNLPKSSDLSF